MPPKIDPRDWDRHFRPGAPRRGGPLQTLANILLIMLALGILGGAGFFAWNYGREQAQETAAAASRRVETTTAAAIATRTARAATPTIAPTLAAIAETPALPAEPILGRATVINGGNLRSEPRVAPETVVGQVCVNDQVEVLEEQTLANGARWYRLRVISAPNPCVAERAAVGVVGWVSASLLGPLSP
ncbi:SH3 domain-containing protein [Candidatus Oscillochloris fontis]|uniref:SH3 domain-containing protein n=1 Tax=Candidatus Oscillochloris fontis TaxID=2496868 RepID=UPI00101D6724|nr:SH3 domain-containing protein [Candidatus Oscillochloris fontis]